MINSILEFMHNNQNTTLVISVIIGFILGIFTKLNANIYSRILTVTIFILLFVMGIGLGMQPDLKTRIASYGISAGVITLFSVFGSIIVTFLLMKFLNKKGAKK